ncbi:hypothetical protein YC2023_115521 [Brassica napus]
MERQKSIMERQKSMESGLLRKSLSIRERKHPNDDGYLETGLSSKRHKEVKKHHNEDGECCVTTSVCLITFIVVTGSFCVGCGYSMFGSIMTLGGLIGAVFSGKISDVLGRKRTMFLCEAFCATGWLCIALAKDALGLDCGRFLLGIGVGIFSYVIPVYIAEIAPKHVRGSFVFANQAKFGRDKECRASLQHLRGHDVDISQEANAIKDTMNFSQQSGETGFVELFQRRYVFPLIIGVGLMLLQQLSGSAGVIYYASSLYERGGFPSAIGTSVMATIMVPKAMIGTIIVDKMGRRTLLMASCAGMGLFALLLSVSYSLQSFGILPELTPLFTFISVLGYIISYALGMGGLPWIIMSEKSNFPNSYILQIFPMNVKVSAGTLVTVTNWACGTFLIFSSVSAVSIVFIYFIVPETKGRSLEEIQTLLSNSVH